MSAFSVEANNLSLSFGDRQVFNKLSFQVLPNELIAILGPSGCGKSSLLRVLAELIHPSQGSLTYADRDNAYPKKSFVFQDPTLLPWRNVLKNTLLPFELTPNQLSKKEQEERAMNWLAQVGMEKSFDLFPHQLSGGMKMRVSLARALISNPDFIFLDEPFAALDELQREKLNVLLRNLFEKTKCNIFFVTHSISEAVFLADRIFYFKSSEPSGLAEFKSPLPSQDRTLSQRYSEEFVSLTKTLFQMGSTP